MITVVIVLLLSLVFLLLLLLALFFWAPAKLRVRLHNSDIQLCLSFLGIPLLRFPTQAKEAPKKHQNKKQPQERASLPLPPKNANAEALLTYAKHLLEELGSLSNHTQLTLHTLWITPPKTDDAASQALLAGAVSGAAATFLGFLDQNCRLVIQSPDAVRITPNFLETDPSLQLDLTLSLAPYRVFGSLVHLSERLQNI